MKMLIRNFVIWTSIFTLCNVVVACTTTKDYELCNSNGCGDNVTFVLNNED